MGLFSKSKSKGSSVIKLLCQPGEAASFKCIFLASYRKLSTQIEWKNASELDDKITRSLNMSSLRQYPCIEDDDFTICGENAVFTYLNIKGQSPSIHPRKARVLASQEYWIQVLNTKFSPILNDISIKNPEIDSILNSLNSALESKNYIVGEVSLADFHWLSVFKVLEESGSGMLNSFSNITAWFEKMKKEIPNYNVTQEKVAA